MIIQPRRFNLRKTLTVLAVLAVAFYFYYQREPPPRLWKISGKHWSDYHVTFLDSRHSLADAQALKTDIDELLDSINRQMSTYIPDSEISRFNALKSTDAAPVSPALAELAEKALALCEKTDGAFNPTLDGLINLWGFGHHGPRHSPTDEEVAAALANIGCDRITATPDHTLRKATPDITLNLNAIAEGWAVDQTAHLLESRGITNYFVEIGGEVYARGVSDKARPWRVGIDRPIDGAMPGDAYDYIVEVNGIGLATSGSYRNFVRDENGDKIAHILDPRTGRPATSSLASVTVAAPLCADADAVATALFVMGAAQGLEWVEKQPGIEALFIEFDGDSFTASLSSGFAALTVAGEP